MWGGSLWMVGIGKGKQERSLHNVFNIMFAHKARDKAAQCVNMGFVGRQDAGIGFVLFFF
tara:strand:+ start:28 stop:207 length:180 start_codon:yes stop_codon:yes gene_type:complete